MIPLLLLVLIALLWKDEQPIAEADIARMRHPLSEGCFRWVLRRFRYHQQGTDWRPG